MQGLAICQHRVLLLDRLGARSLWDRHVRLRNGLVAGNLLFLDKGQRLRHATNYVQRLSLLRLDLILNAPLDEFGNVNIVSVIDKTRPWPKYCPRCMKGDDSPLGLRLISQFGAEAYVQEREAESSGALTYNYRCHKEGGFVVCRICDRFELGSLTRFCRPGATSPG